jgi:dTDP-glucose pyrophosphorylase
LKVLLTMAGLGSRFKNAGYEAEKYAIEFRGHSLLEWSLASLLNFREFELVLITRDFPGIREYLDRCAGELGFHKRSVIVLQETTRGQAETAIMGAWAFDEDDSILIFNTDTYIDPSYLKPEMIRGEGWIPTFEAPGDKWSFVEANSDGLASRTTEKERISDDCSVGLYYFSSFLGFKELVENASFSNELYVAPLYNQWIAQGHETYLHRLPEEAVTVLGTPEDLEAAMSQDRPNWPENCTNPGS